MEAHRRGGYFFWDNRGHGIDGAVWTPMQDPAYLARFRNDLSFPALTDCDLDSELGDGSATSGDSVGSVNGHVEWGTPHDQPGEWSVTLSLRGLVLSTGAWAAPESARVDVTPRRLQSFAVAPFQIVPWRTVRVADEAVLGEGWVPADSTGLVTVESVRVHRLGTRLELGTPVLAAVSPARVPGELRLACATLARGGRLAPVVSWPGAQEARLELLDVTGRRVATLFRGRPTAGEARHEASPAHLAPGLYFLRAVSGERQVVRRVVVLP
jgi:hypothetical protein